MMSFDEPKKTIVPLRYFLIAALVVLGLVIVMPKPPVYRIAPMHILAVDEKTGEPIPGVVAEAHWHRRRGLLFSTSAGAYKFIRVVGDENGLITFPAWSVWRPWFTFTYMNDEQPVVRLIPAEHKSDIFTNFDFLLRLHKRDSGDPSIAILPFRLAPVSDDMFTRFAQYTTYSQILLGDNLYRCRDFENEKGLLLKRDRWEFWGERNSHSRYSTGSWLNKDEYSQQMGSDTICDEAANWLREQRLNNREQYETFN